MTGDSCGATRCRDIIEEERSCQDGGSGTLLTVLSSYILALFFLQACRRPTLLLRFSTPLENVVQPAEGNFFAGSRRTDGYMLNTGLHEIKRTRTNGHRCRRSSWAIFFFSSCATGRKCARRVKVDTSRRCFAKSASLASRRSVWSQQVLTLPLFGRRRHCGPAIRPHLRRSRGACVCVQNRLQLQVLT